MKQLAVLFQLIAILCLSFPVQASNWFSVIARKKAGGGVGGCSTADSTLPQDVFIEGFEGAGYELSWSEAGTTANINENYDSTSLSTGKPTGGCNVALEVDVPNDGTETYSSYTTTFTLASNLDLYFYLYIPSTGGPPDTTDYRFFVASNNSSPASFQRARLHLVNTSGTYTVYAQGATASTSITVSTDTWHKFKLHLNTTTSSSYIQMDDGTQETFTRYTGTTMSYVHVGGTEGVDAGEGGKIYFDLVAGDQP